MRLIVETGSFTEWVIIDNNKVVATANTDMVNPFSQSRREISRLIRLTLPDIFFHKKYEKVFYYGSGCSTELRKKKVEASLTTQFKAHVTVESTLLAAARGLLQDNAGIACVLGNRSGSCHYDGSNITAQVLSGGYLLGDEGSSIVLGRMFLADVVKNMAPSELSIDFYQHFSVSANNLQDFVYEMKEPDMFLAEVAIYLKEHKEHPYMRSLVGRNFKEFFNLINHFDDEIKDEKMLDEYILRVTNGEPLQYVIGEAYFVNSNYYVTPDVLIPRQETEELAVATLKMIVKMFGKEPKIKIVDIGTGSGILGIYLKEYFKNSHVICTDISEKALQIAEKNAKAHNVEIDFRKGDMIEPIKEEEKVDVIISNPPYIGDKSTVDPQTLKHEPHLALFAYPKTKYYEKIMSLIDTFVLNDKFLMAFEIGEDMKDELTHIIESKYKGIMYKFEKDIYGQDRYLYIVKDEGITYVA